MRGLISFVIVAVTVIFQLTVVSRIAFPGGSGPDLVLVVVAALALASGPLAGALLGFWGGLAMDVAPPGSHFVGQDALVFCLIGYACGLLADDSSGDGVIEPGHTALFEIVVTAAGAICGEALVALLGVMLSDPRVTWPAITHVLPVAVGYDVLLCPFVLYAAAAAWRLAGVAPRARARGVWGDGSPQKRGVPGGRPPGLALPRLRLAEAGRGQGSMAGALGTGANRRPAGREPHLKLGRAGARSSLGGARPASSALRTSGFSRSSMGRSLLGGSVFSHSSSLGLNQRGSRSARSSPFGRTAPLGGLAGNTPRFSRGGALSRLSGLLHRPAQPRSPGRGWLRSPAARRASLGRGTIGSGGTMSRRAFGRGGPSRAFGRGGPSRADMGRGWAGARTPGLGSGRKGPARLRMSRPRKPKIRRRWRPGGGYL